MLNILGLIAKFLLGLVFIIVGAGVFLAISDTLYKPKCAFPALAGKTVDSGDEQIEFLVVQPDLLQLDVIREPIDHAVLDPKNGHIHEHQEERFEVTEGEGEFIVGDNRLKLKAGMSLLFRRIRCTFMNR